MGGLLETGATARGEQAAQGGGAAAGVFGRHRGGAASDRMGVAAATADSAERPRGRRCGGKSEER